MEQWGLAAPQEKVPQTAVPKWGEQGRSIEGSQAQTQAQLHHSRRCSSGEGQMVKAQLNSRSQGKGVQPWAVVLPGSLSAWSVKEGGQPAAAHSNLALSPGRQASRTQGPCKYFAVFKLLRIVAHWYIYLFHSLGRFLNPYLESWFFFSLLEAKGP